MKLQAKKSLGQHFLRSKIALRQIIATGELAANDVVLEIGPGEGALTHELLHAGANVIAVETDARAITVLRERFQTFIASQQLILLEGDIREEAVQRTLFHKTYLGSSSYKLIANIPYYITGYLFRLFLEQLRQPTQIVFLVQKEVAELIVARDGKEGLLSLSIKAFGIPRYITKVKREAFSPPPKVDSAIILVEQINRNNFTEINSEYYFQVLKAGLGSKRKMLLGNIAASFDISKEHMHELFAELEISRQVRGEDLPTKKWLLLATRLSETAHAKRQQNSQPMR